MTRFLLKCTVELLSSSVTEFFGLALQFIMHVLTSSGAKVKASWRYL